MDKAVISSLELVNSVFSRLFYFGGAQTTHFDKFSDVTAKVTGDRIIVWNINWEGNKGIQLVNASVE